MLPDSGFGFSSGSGLTSFSFFQSAGQPVLNTSSHEDSRAEQAQPPSALVLCTGAATTSTLIVPGADCISMLPRMLIYLIKAWLIDKEALQLILASHRMRLEVQSFYALRLRPAIAHRCASPIASYQDTVNLRPAQVFMGEEGEQMFQQCLALKTPDMPADQYRDAVLHILKARLALAKNLGQIRELFVGAGLGFGGTNMSAEHRDALMKAILESINTSSHEQMGAMVAGVCAAIGSKPTRIGHHEAVFNQILASWKTCTPSQMGSMAEAMCIISGGKNMPQQVRAYVVTKILGSFETCSATQIRAMIYCVCLALGGRNMSSTHRDGVLHQIQVQYDDNRRLPLQSMLQGLCKGLGDTEMTFSGKDIQLTDTTAVLAQILDWHASWNNREMGEAVSSLCVSLGGRHMSATNRDAVVKQILASHATSSPDQIGAMILSVCHALGGKRPGGVTRLTQKNLEAVLRLVLKSHATSSPAQMGAMLHYLFRSLGQTNMHADRRQTITAGIRKSGRAAHIVEAISLTPGGSAVVEFLQLKTVNLTKRVVNYR